ncbi:MAG: DJ-1/PfpI family protein [Dehalococcoidia bacterium]|uniref:DJ-1/PfpI family protein n=1 Tax=Candidatus Amarobacter glycogenicus TaxID=3140699 RepID=UPI002A0F2F0B|nr:DJ-1/PfpI family protein [Dehalococcoidia bacterium]MBK9613419.1 DJ-1/PfpI family protein [Dehalococcoidia bacterium]
MSIPGGVAMAKSVAVVLFEGVEELDFVGPWEVFTMAGLVTRGDVTAFTVAERAGLVKCAKGLQVVAEFAFEDCPKADIVLVPGGLATRVEVDNPEMIAFLSKMDARAEYTTSVCTGALLLDKAGILKGLRATTHWGSISELKATGTETIENTRFVDNGRVITSSGVSAGIDMSLHLVGKIWGAEVAKATQKYMEYYPEPPAWD